MELGGRMWPNFPKFQKITFERAGWLRFFWQLEMPMMLGSLCSSTLGVGIDTTANFALALRNVIILLKSTFCEK